MFFVVVIFFQQWSYNIDYQLHVEIEKIYTEQKQEQCDQNDCNYYDDL